MEYSTGTAQFWEHAFTVKILLLFILVFETFKEMLVQINGLQSEVMEYLLTFLYTARTTITPSNVQMLLEAANLFQIDLLKRKCTDFMYKQLDPCNCLGMKVSLYRAPVSDTLILTGTLVTGTLGTFISTGIQYAAYLFQRAFWLTSIKS